MEWEERSLGEVIRSSHVIKSTERVLIEGEHEPSNTKGLKIKAPLYRGPTTDILWLLVTCLSMYVWPPLIALTNSNVRTSNINIVLVTCNVCGSIDIYSSQGYLEYWHSLK